METPHCSRTSLPDRRHSTTSKLKFNGQSIFLNVGFDEAGSIKELFLDLNKRGTLVNEWARAIGILVSILLQVGVTTEQVVATIRNVSEPNDVLELIANELESLAKDYGSQ